LTNSTAFLLVALAPVAILAGNSMASAFPVLTVKTGELSTISAQLATATLKCSNQKALLKSDGAQDS
jgi:hypothetical protein